MLRVLFLFLFLFCSPRRSAEDHDLLRGHTGGDPLVGHGRPLYPRGGQDGRPEGGDGQQQESQVLLLLLPDRQHRPDTRPPRLQERQPRVRHRPAQTEGGPLSGADWALACLSTQHLRLLLPGPDRHCGRLGQNLRHSVPVLGQDPAGAGGDRHQSGGMSETVELRQRQGRDWRAKDVFHLLGGLLSRVRHLKAYTSPRILNCQGLWWGDVPPEREQQGAHRGLQLRPGGLPELGAWGLHQGGHRPGLDQGDPRHLRHQHGELRGDPGQGQGRSELAGEGAELFWRKTSLLNYEDGREGVIAIFLQRNK